MPSTSKLAFTFSRLLFVLFICTTTSVFAFQNDGPYVRYANNGLEATWICDGKTVKQTYPKTAGTHIEPACGFNQAITIQAEENYFPVPVQFTTKKLAALSDVHGQYQTMLQLLQKNGIINDQLQWGFGDGHVVMTGDVFDRGDQVNETLWLLYKLDSQAKEAGGAFHLLLGNHETMVMANDIRYVNKDYFKVTSLLEKSYPELYNQETVLGRWLRSKPVIIQVNDSLFMHGGLHPDFRKYSLSLQDVNEQFRRSLGLGKNEIKKNDTLSFLYGSLGPIWYRGYFNAPKVDSDEFDQLLNYLKVKRIIVGHTTMSGVFSHMNGRVISIDSDIKSKNGEILLFENSRFSIGNLQGIRLALPESP
jgi:hypothetical protein